MDALPPNARVAALQHSGIHAMARAADEVMLESRSTNSDRQLPAVNSLSLLDGELDGAAAFPAPLAPSPSVSAVARPTPAKKSDLCQIHARYGKDSYKCAAPSSCKMKNILRPRPPAPSASSASGNAKAGGQ